MSIQGNWPADKGTGPGWTRPSNASCRPMPYGGDRSSSSGVSLASASCPPVSCWRNCPNLAGCPTPHWQPWVGVSLFDRDRGPFQSDA